MYRCILVPVDGTEVGEHALGLAAGVAGRAGATLHLVHVQVPMIVPAGVDAASLSGVWGQDHARPDRRYLEATAARLRAGYGIEVEEVILHGPVAPALEQYAGRCVAGLVVMSTHAHSRFSRLWRHGVVEHVSRHLEVPLLLSRYDPHDSAARPVGRRADLDHILVALDGESDPTRLLRHVQELGSVFRSRFTLLRVVGPVQARRGVGSGGRASSLQFLNALAERLRARGFDVRTRVIVSDTPAEVILGFAFARNTPGGRIHCIAMEAHPHGVLGRIIGSHTVDAVLRDTPVPVLLFEPVSRDDPREVTGPRLASGPG